MELIDKLTYFIFYILYLKINPEFNFYFLIFLFYDFIYIMTSLMIVK